VTDHIFLRLDAKFALGADDLQWILYRSRRAEPSSMDAPLKVERSGEWKAVSFVSSQRGILMRCMREKGSRPCARAQLVLAGFAAWKAAGDAPAAALKPLVSKKSRITLAEVRWQAEGVQAPVGASG
jgi:hypothetical protein